MTLEELKHLDNELSWLRLSYIDTYGYSANEERALKVFLTLHQMIWDAQNEAWGLPPKDALAEINRLSRSTGRSGTDLIAEWAFRRLWNFMRAVLDTQAPRSQSDSENPHS